MLKQFALLIALSAAVTACGADDVKKVVDVDLPPEETPEPATKPTDQPEDPDFDTEVSVSGDISANTTWVEGTKYILSGKVAVLPGVTLTIEPGVLVVGEKSPLGWLQVQRGAKLVANGTAAKPIIFTSSKPQGSRASGDWGGIVILGKAKNNMCASAACDVALEGNGGTHGGVTDGDNSGSLKYVIVEFAGWELAPGNELNGITLGSVGSGTTLDHVQVHYGLDDGIEFFGGSVNLKYGVVSGTDDDCFDWDEGYHGKMQYLVCMHVATRGDRGFEGAGNKNTFTALPLANPVVYNYTFVGRGNATGYLSQDRGITLKEGSRGQLFNGIVMNFGKSAMDIDNLTSSEVAGGTALGNDYNGDAQGNDPGVEISNTIVYANTTTANTATNQVEADSDGLDELTDVWNAGTNNTIADPGVTVNVSAPNLVPASVATGATPPADGFFDAAATHIGAFGTTNWMSGWTRFGAN